MIREAISGTIPPYFWCAAICDATWLASNCGPDRSSLPRRIATAVSSQEVSSAKSVFTLNKITAHSERGEEPAKVDGSHGVHWGTAMLQARSHAIRRSGRSLISLQLQLLARAVAHKSSRL